MNKNKQKKIFYRVGDLFKIPSSGDGFYLGQIVADTKAEIGAPFCYIYRRELCVDNSEWNNLTAAGVISASFITPELIEGKRWLVCANRPVPTHPAMRKLEETRKNGFVGSIVVGAGLVSEYIDTFYGLINEDHWPDPSYVYRFFLIPAPNQSRKGAN